MANHPVSGPMPIEAFKELVNVPFGEATKRIRKYDPCWGLKPGEKIKWKVVATAQMRGEAEVEASSQQEADALADKLPDSAFDWDAIEEAEVEIEEVKPA